MIRQDIEIIQRKNEVVVQSSSNFCTLARRPDSGGCIALFCTSMPEGFCYDIDLSGITATRGSNPEKGLALFEPLTFYSTEKMAEIIVSLFEKYEL